MFLCDAKRGLLYKSSVDICSCSMMLSACSWFRVELLIVFIIRIQVLQALRREAQDQGTERYSIRELEWYLN